MRFVSALLLASTATGQAYFADLRRNPLPTTDGTTLEVFVADVDQDGRADLVPNWVGDRYTPAAPAFYLFRGRGVFAASSLTFASRENQSDPVRGVGDLDGDGDVDVVTADGLWRNDLAGAFTWVAAPWSFDFAARSEDRYAIGDVDGDGRADVCTGHATGGLWLNQGGGTFVDATARIPTSMVGTPVLADFDGDGDLDLLVFTPGSSTPAQLARNDGVGNFTALTAAQFPAPALDVRDVALADFDGNGRLDLVGVGPAGAFLLSNLLPAGFVDQSNRLATTAPALAVAAGDVDGDGVADLVFGGSVQHNLGTSFALVSGAWTPTPGRIEDLVLYDADGDGDLDLVEARAKETDSLYTYGVPDEIEWNDGHGHFRRNTDPPVPLTSAPVGAGLADIDGDGDLDIIVGSPGVLLLKGDGRGAFAAPSSLQLSVRGRPLPGDLDGDGDVDVVLVDDLALHVLVNPGNGQMQLGTTVPISGLGAGSVATDGVLGDFDGDGRLDVLVTTVQVVLSSIFPETDLLYHGTPAGWFTATPTLLPGTTTAFSVDAGDIDGDGDLDAVVDDRVVYRNTPSGFVAQTYPNASYESRSRVRLADLDGDGDLDLACGNGCYGSPRRPSCDTFFDSPPESVVWNDGSGNFGSDQVLPTPLSQTLAMALGDVDEDGDVDLVFGNTDYPNTPCDQLVLNDGGRTFHNAFGPPNRGDAFVFDTGNTHAVFLADLDFDGDLDLLAIDDPKSGFPQSRVYVNLQRHLRAPDLARLGFAYRLRLEGATQGGALFLAGGPGNIPTRFGRFGLDFATTVPAGTFGPPSTGRSVETTPTVPPNPSLLGATLWWQGAVLHQNAIRLTNVIADAVGW